MSLKGKPNEERALHDEPFAVAGEERKEPAKLTQTTAQKTSPAAAAGNETESGSKTTSSTKEPVMGLDSNNGNTQTKVPLKTID